MFANGIAVCKWHCKYCSKTMTSSVTRLIIHLTKLGGQAGPCPTIPDAIQEECKAKYLPLKTRRGIARALEEVVPPDCDLSDSGDDASPSALVASNVAASSGGGSSSSFKKKASSQGGRPSKQAKQATLAQVGKEHVVQVITDNASNCASMGRKLEAEFPSIVWTPCASHCIDLLLEDIGELPWVKDTLSQALSIVTFISVKVKVLAIFRTYSDLELKKPSATRIAAMWLLLERIYDVQNKLQKTVVSDEFKEWLEGETTTSQQEAKAIERLCLKEEFWQEVKGLVIAILPLYKVLRMTDMEGSTIGLLHHFMEEASKEIEACTILDGPIDGSRLMWTNASSRLRLKSLNKDRDPEEEQIFRELYMELEEIDCRVSRTRSRKKVVVRGSATRGRGSSTSAEKLDGIFVIFESWKLDVEPRLKAKDALIEEFKGQFVACKSKLDANDTCHISRAKPHLQEEVKELKSHVGNSLKTWTNVVKHEENTRWIEVTNKQKASPTPFSPSIINDTLE
ncbi:hypothetical protein L7F22_001065 [Adiantum nelumboides]|nr:hypothetical protein [Adiantum nelumboides]